MKIIVVGAGPAGLLFALLTKRRRPGDEITVLEQNAADATFGFYTNLLMSAYWARTASPAHLGFLIPVGGYDTRSVRTGYNFGRQRPLSGNVTAQYGTFYTGHLTTIGVSQGRVNLSNLLSVEPSLSVNWVRLAQGSFTTRLVGSRITYTVTPQMFASALLQYNSSNHAVSANVRLRWEYQPAASSSWSTPTPTTPRGRSDSSGCRTVAWS